jgi:ubiquinone biosynthesis protein
MALRAPPGQKFKTWKFATEFIVRKTFTRDQAKLGAWTRDKVVELGPTFIKLGQIVSTRSDIYPLAFVKELESLQDDVPPVALGDSVDTSVFQTFDEVPYKSASIGQVHRATLKTGEDVIVKVKRPHIYETMKFDTDTLMDIVGFLESIGFDTGTGTSNVLQESVDYLLSETDYGLEIANATMFREAMTGVEWITAPRMYQEYCTDDMIVMSYVPSEKLTNLTDPGINKKTVCKALINSYIIQTMEKGFFHADPHPGNLGFTPDARIVFYDFGLVIPISDNLMEGFKKLFGCIIQRDTAGIVDILIELGIILPTTEDRDDIRLFFKTVLNYLETLDGSSVANDIMEDDVLVRLAQKKPFMVPTSFVYLAKTFSTIEGICVKLDPDFTYYEYLEPLIQEQVSDIMDINKIVSTTAEMPSRIKDISTAVLGLEKSRSSMTRKIEKTRKEIQQSQMILLFALVALEQGHVTEYMGLLALYATVKRYFS